MSKQGYYQAIALGALVSALSDSIPLLSFVNVFCCIGIASGGFVTLWLLQRQFPQKEYFTTPEVIHLGLLTGLVGAFLSFVFQYIVFLWIGNWQVQWLLNAMNNMPELPPMWENLYEELQRPEYQNFAGLAILVRNLIIFPIFTFFGALIMNKILLRKHFKNTGE